MWKAIKAIGDHWKQPVESKGFIKNYIDINRDHVPLKKQKEIFNELLTEISSKLHGAKYKINLNKYD